MTTEKAVIRTFEEVVGTSLTYVERVKLKHCGTEIISFMCVGDHSVFLVNGSIKRVIEGGEFYFAHLVELFYDENADDVFMLILHENRPAEWESPFFIVHSEHRERMVNYISAAWQADYMWRFGEVNVFPRRWKPLTKERQKPLVEHPAGLETFRYAGYSFWLRNDFDEVPTLAGEKGTGVFRDKLGIEVSLEVTEPQDLGELLAARMDHVRFVAIDTRQVQINELRNFYVIYDRLYTKRMNLSRDRSQWVAWEFLVRSDDVCIATVVLRRKFMPPLLDTAQDITIVLTCPTRFIHEWKMSPDQLLHDARIAADSLSSAPLQPTLYEKMIQVKLDTLAFPPDVYTFTLQELNMRPRHELAARKLLKAVVHLLAEASVIRLDDELRDALGDDTPLLSDPLPKVLADLSLPGVDDSAQNRWLRRISEYCAWAFEGGLVGSLFNTVRLIEALRTGDMSAPVEAELRLLLRFMVHWRSPSMDIPFENEPLVEKLKLPDVDQAWFNSTMVARMMQEGEFRAQLDDKCYGTLMAVLLKSSNSSQGLIASVCRTLISLNPVPRLVVDAVREALILAIKTQGVYVSMHATAVLVHLAKSNDILREALVNSELPQLLQQNFALREDDLDEYMLELLVVLCLNDDHRVRLCHPGMVQPLVAILTTSYSNMYKHRTLVPLCTLLALACNSDVIRNQLSEGYPTLECLSYIVDSCGPDRKTLKSSALYAIRKLCENSPWNKEKVGIHIIDHLVDELTELYMDNNLGAYYETEESLEYVKATTMLFEVLAVDYDNACRMAEKWLRKIVVELHHLLPVQERGMPLEKSMYSVIHQIEKIEKNPSFVMITQDPRSGNRNTTPRPHAASGASSMTPGSHTTVISSMS